MYLVLENIEHSRTRARSPQTNGICERHNKTRKDVFYSVAFRRKVCWSVDEIRLDLDEWLRHCNHEGTFGQVLLRENADKDVRGFDSAG